MRKSYYYGAMALGLLFTACSADNLNEPVNNGPLEADQTFYVTMSISGDIPTGTRASGETGNPDDEWTGGNGEKDFEAGTADESRVSNAYFVFYDAKGQMVGDIVQVDLNDQTTVYLQETPEGATVEKSYRSIVPLAVRKGESSPTQVICYINPITPTSLQNPLNVIQTRTREAVQSGGYFAMSNSVFYNDEGNIQIATPIGSGMLFTTEEEANKALWASMGKEYDSSISDSDNYNSMTVNDSGLVKIYVERYASRLTFDNSDLQVNTYVTVNRSEYNAAGQITVNSNEKTLKKVELEFQPLYWALNAEAKTTYVVKSFRRETTEGQVMAENYPYNLLDYRINPADPTHVNTDLVAPTAADILQTGAWNWNSVGYNRSYWAISPAYFTDTYPEVSSDVEDLELNQNYLSFNELSTKGFSFAEGVTGVRAAAGAKYFKETTVGNKALAGGNPAAAVPSVILVGKYKISVGGTEVTLPANTGFYTYLSGPVEKVDATVTEDRPYIYFDANNDGSSVIDDTGSMLMRFLAQTTILYKQDLDDEGNPIQGSYSRLYITDANDLTTLLNAVSVSEIDNDVMGSSYAGDEGEPLKLQANARSLQFRATRNNDGVATALPNAITNNLFIAAENGFKKIVLDTKENIQNDEIKLSDANAILMQQVGYAYYYHLGEGYYNIPVKHLGWYRTGNTQKDEKKIDWSLVRVGDFGMVRNHSYNIKVNTITGLASGIGGNDVPIVPPANTTDVYIAYAVRILKWAVVPTQGVDL